GLLEMRRGERRAVQPGERTGEVEVRLEALDAAGHQLFEAARRRRVVAAIQGEDAAAHHLVCVAELLDLVLRIGAGCGGRRAAADVAKRAEPLELIGRQRSAGRR